MRNSVRSIVIPSSVLMADNYPTEAAWSRKPIPETLFTPFVECLRSRLPQLREIALFLPIRESSEDFYCHWEPGDVANMLLDDRDKVDTVRLFFKQRLFDDFDYKSHMIGDVTSWDLYLSCTFEAEYCFERKLITTRKYGPLGGIPSGKYLKAGTVIFSKKKRYSSDQTQAADPDTRAPQPNKRKRATTETSVAI